jgi:glutathione synthase/RimK-type ligase-like ATP-grasp enzyme
LVIGAAETCNVPTEYLFDRSRFETISVYLLPPTVSEDALAMSINALPDFDIAFNAVGDADRGAPFLDRAANVCRQLDRPILNSPSRIARTRRDILPGLLKDIPGLAVPTTRRVRRADISEVVAAEQLQFPLLLRPIGSHGGDDLVRVENSAQIATYLETVPAEEFYLSNYWDFRSADGYFRKYRLIFVGGAVYPYHLAIRGDWLVHYWRADMSDAMKREEEAFLTDFRSAFRGAAADAVIEVARRLDLDYAGMDCSLLADGRVLLFEANATMLVHLRESRVTAAYKHAHVPRIVDAMSDLVLRRTGPVKNVPVHERVRSNDAFAQCPRS